MFIRSFQKHFITPNVDKKALSKLSSAVYTAIRSNSISSLEEFEKFCIALLGCENDAARETAVRLLHGIYDGHDWQRLEPFEPVIRNVGDSFVVEIDSSVKQAERKKKKKNKNKKQKQKTNKQKTKQNKRLSALRLLNRSCFKSVLLLKLEVAVVFSFPSSQELFHHLKTKVFFGGKKKYNSSFLISK